MLRQPVVVPNPGTSLDANPALSLINLAAFAKWMAAARVARTKYTLIRDQVNTICDRLMAYYPDLTAEVMRLRLELRLEARGTPTTEPLHVNGMDALEFDGMSESQYNAHTVVLKRAFKAVAQVVHPDKAGGDAELFKQAKEALANRDIGELTYIYVSAVHIRNLYWRNSAIGIEFAQNAYDKPSVTLIKLQTSPGFAMARHWMCGRIAVAKSMMELHLKERIIKLMNELDHLRTSREEQRHHQDQNQTQEPQRGTCDQEKEENGAGRAIPQGDGQEGVPG